ncbi:MAG TPA: TIGR01777 family oxidoreductase [Candidatus Solibacter sp.]|nr:TIGR01777 family oxidoreductase [Candidatus Solibacter sp.]
MKIVITGGSGLVGRRLIKHLMKVGHTVSVLSRHAGTNMPAGVIVNVWDGGNALTLEESLRNADAVVHLAGEPVAQRWSSAAMDRIRGSRIDGTRNLVAAIGKLAKKPEVLVSASAIGYYGSRRDEMLDEHSTPAQDFLGSLCIEWEREARAAEALGVRVVCVRTGVVLDTRGGALAKMLPPFKMGVGGRLGDGCHWMSWIHADDLCAMYRFAVETPTVRGAINGVAPNPATNTEFTKALGAALHRPTIFPMPAFVLKVMFGEMSEILLASQRVVPKAAQSAGFQFRFPELAPALADVLRT